MKKQVTAVSNNAFMGEEQAFRPALSGSIKWPSGLGFAIFKRREFFQHSYFSLAKKPRYWIRDRKALAICLLWLILAATLANGQSQKSAAFIDVPPPAPVANSLTVRLKKSQISFDLQPFYNRRQRRMGVKQKSPVVVPVTLHWNLDANSIHSVRLVAYFASAHQALTSGHGGIPSARILGSFNGAPFAPFTHTGSLAPAGSGLELFQQPITAKNQKKQMEGVLRLKLDLSDMQDLPAGDYQGIVSVQAQAQ